MYYQMPEVDKTVEEVPRHRRSIRIPLMQSTREPDMQIYIRLTVSLVIPPAGWVFKGETTVTEGAWTTYRLRK